jgi:hypothetical protein
MSPTRLLQRAAGALAALLLALPAQAQPAYTRDQVMADLRAGLDWIAATHPDIAHTADPGAIEARLARVEAALPEDLTRREAWIAIGGFGPLYADAHAGFAAPALNLGPLPPVKIANGQVRIAETIHPDSRFEPGDLLIEIDGHDVGAMVQGLIPTLRGESDALRARILELRFADFLALWTGSAELRRVTVRRGDALLSLALNPGTDRPGPAAAAFSMEIAGAEARLGVDTFSREREAEFAAFLEASFAEIAASGAERLVIDLRENGGGARQLSDRLMAYLTDQRYTPLSAVAARVAEENIGRLPPGAEIGQVVSLPFAQWVEPPADLAHRFEGDITVLIGPNTYSQAIVFAATAQDFAIARLAGEPTIGAANQTGQVQRLVLEHTGFEARAPLYIFTRASGETGGAPLRPGEG